MFLCFFRPYDVPRGVKSKCNELIFNSLHLLAEREGLNTLKLFGNGY